MRKILVKKLKVTLCIWLCMILVSGTMAPMVFAESLTNNTTELETSAPEPSTESSPETIPGTTPEVTPGTTPEVTPGTTPEVTPGTTPEVTPGTTPEVTPETTPGTTPEVTPEEKPDGTIKDQMEDILQQNLKPETLESLQVMMLDLTLDGLKFSGGTGTEAEPYKIASKDDLATLAADVNTGTNYEGIYFQLQGDITLDGNWTPIGKDSSKPFAGYFDGNNATISGMNISAPSADYQALFGYTTGKAVIQDITVSGTVVGGNYCALVVGYNQGKLSHVTAQGTVSGTTNANNAYFAGIAAYNTGNMDHCVNQGDVSLTVAHINSYVGGVTAYTSGDLSDCINEAVVKTEGTTQVSGGVYTAGIAAVGAATSSFKDCVNKGDVSTNTKMNMIYLGGIIANAQGASILNCSNSGSLIADTKTSSTPTVWLGGLISYSNNNLQNIFYCSNTGAVAAVNGTGTCYGGGLVGQIVGSTSKVMYCYNQGSVSANTSGAKNVGGLFGTVNTNNAVTGCYTAGTVGQTISSSASGNYHNTYYLDTTSGNIMNKGGLSRTEEEMKSPTFISLIGYVFRAVDNEFPTLKSNAENIGDDIVKFCYNESSLVALGIEIFEQFDSNVSVARNGDGTVTGPSTVTKDYYKFLGWYADKKGTGEPVDLSKTVEKGTTLYAKWDKADIGVIYRMNDGTNDEFISTTIPCGNMPDRPMNSPMRTGYSFTEWYTDEACTTPYDFSTKVMSVTTLYAGWETALDGEYFKWYTKAPESDTYTISNGNELKAFADLVNGTAPKEAGVKEPVSFANKKIVMNAGGKAPVDLSGIEFTKLIGKRTSTPFQGTLSGSFTNLNINKSGIANQALFGYVKDAAFKDLTISGTVVGGNYSAGLIFQAENSTFQNVTSTVSVTGANYVGGLVAYAKGGSFQNVSIGTADAEGVPAVVPAIAGNGYVGGIVGDFTANEGATFTSCQSFATVNGGATGFTGGLVGRVNCMGQEPIAFNQCSNKGAVSGSKYVGGLLGGADPGTASLQPVKFDHCTNEGPVTGGQYAGGIVGTIGLTATNTSQVTLLTCINKGSVSGTDSVGGLCGSIFSAATDKTLLDHCQNDGIIGNTGSKTGGLVGQATQAEIKNGQNKGAITITGSGGTTGGIAGDLNNVLIVDCKNNGAISINSGSTVGGLAGTMKYSQIKGSSNTASLSAISTSASNFGGLVGTLDGSSITKSFNTGDITGGQQAAGIVYTMTYSQVSNCYNVGKISVNSASGTASGIAGNQTDGISYVKSCYTYGSVTGGSKLYAVSGGTTPHIVNSYYLDTAVASPQDGADKNIAKQNQEEFKGHALAYKLDGGGTANRSLVWTGWDTYPVFATEANPCTYKLEQIITGDGSISLKPNADYVPAGTEVTVKAIPNGQNSVTLLSVKDKEGTSIKLTDGKFTTEAKDYKISATFGIIDPSKEYTIIFHSNGGSDVSSQVIKGGNTVNKPADPVKTEGDKKYVFAGWYTDEQLSNEYDFNTLVTLNLELYAKWKEQDQAEIIETGMTIRSGGTYYLADPVVGTISIETTEPVTIKGGVAQGQVILALTGGCHVTIQNLSLTNCSMIDVQGDNTLYLKGKNQIISTGSTGWPAIHLPTGSELTIDGDEDGMIYMQKQPNDAVIGSRLDSMPCGTLNIVGGQTFIWRHQHATGIGCGSYDPPPYTKDSVLNISGGQLVIGNQGGNSSPIVMRQINITGGTLLVDKWSSSGSTPNIKTEVLTINGGSVKVVRGASPNQVSGALRVDNNYWIAGKVQGDKNGTPVYLAKLNMQETGLASPFTVTCEDKIIYSGNGHTASVKNRTGSLVNDFIEAMYFEGNTKYTDPNPDKNLYLYLTGTKQILTAIGGDKQQVTYSATRGDSDPEFKLSKVIGVSFEGSHASARVNGEWVKRSLVALDEKKLSFTVVADEGYEITDVKASSGKLEGTYTLSELTGDSTVTITTKKVEIIPLPGDNNNHGGSGNGNGTGSGDGTGNGTGTGTGNGNGAGSSDTGNGTGDSNQSTGKDGQGGSETNTTSNQHTALDDSNTKTNDSQVIASAADDTKIAKDTDTEQGGSSGGSGIEKTSEKEQKKTAVTKEEEKNLNVFEIIKDVAKKNPVAAAAASVSVLGVLGAGGVVRYRRISGKF